MKLELPPDAVSLAALIIPTMVDEDRWYGRCADGDLTARDVAAACGVTPKAATRAVRQFCKSVEAISTLRSATLTLDGDKPTAERTRAEMAVAIGKHIGIGKFAIEKRVAERQAARPPEQPKERRMPTQQHPWKTGEHGRSIRTVVGGRVEATLQCSRCPRFATVNFRQLAGAADMDAKFKQKGWLVDPAKCPEHNPRVNARKRETTTMTAKPSPAAIQGTARMFGLLQTHFDDESGTYSKDWSDQKIAAETNLPVELVAATRVAAFGELKEPPEIAALAADIDALQNLIEETVAPLRAELGALKVRLADVRKRFGG